jgi:hypothetical protein
LPEEAVELQNKKQKTNENNNKQTRTRLIIGD